MGKSNIETGELETEITQLEEINPRINESVTEHKPLETALDLDKLDGGYGWLIVLVGFLTNFIIFGSAYSYGILKTYYLQAQFGSQTVISFVGPLIVASICLGSIVTGRVDRSIGHRRCFLIGTMAFSSGLLASSWSTQDWHLLITQGLMMGLGGSMSYISAVSSVIEWFDKKRGIAFGIAVAGSGIGGLILSPGIQYLITNLGISWTLRLFSLISLIVLLLCGFIIREPKRIIEEKTYNLDFSLLQDPKFIFLMLGNTIFGLGFLVPLLSIQNYGIDLGFTKGESALFVGLINGAAAVGRVVMGSLADKFGALNTATVALTCSGICILGAWSVSTSFTAIVIFCLLYGLFSSAYASLTPVIGVQVFGTRQVAITASFIYAALGVSSLIGAPIADWILVQASEPGQKNYLVLIVYSGVASLLGSLFILLLKITCQPNGFLSKV